MAEFNLERIRFRWKSDWTVSTDYVKDDVVRFEGKSYVCLIGHESDSTSIYGDLNLPAPNTRWELMFDGNQWRSDWTSDTLYNLGDIIKYNGYLYQCTTGHQSTNIVSQGPIDDIEKWTIVATTYNWLNTWTPSVANIDPLLAVPQYYNLGDVVTYNGITYICTAKHLAASTYYLGLEFDQDKWKIVTRSDNWRTDWTVNTRYAVDDIVKYGAISYRCLTGHTSNTDLALGLEDDQAKWEIFLEGIDYKGVWSVNTRYKRFDIVKSGGSLWRSLTGHTSTTTLREDLANWSIWVPGLEFEAVWDSGTEYNAGDIVVYGGYSYTALTNNTNSVPSVNGILQDTGDWEVLVAGYRHLGDWSAITAYKTGDVLRDQGYLYIAVGDSTNIKPDTDITKWQILVDGRKWKNYWIDNIEYHLGDVVTYAGVAYICINRHLGTESENRPDLDLLNTENPSDIHYWTTLLQGTASNVMTNRGDLRTRDASDTLRFGIGLPGNIIKSIDGNIAWENFEEVANVFYVSTSGNDVPGSGLTLNAPFRTVKYACQYVADNVDNNTTNTTIFIKTGIFEEELPITVPRNCALVGDELRSTVITPEPGSISSNMFYVNNGSGIRNMTLQGLSGALGVPNQYLTRRPTAGAYVSLDPGTGPDDSSVWITNKSCYVQNVTTFGTGCIGMKIDGALHNGGNRSVVANDFTQVISDGIGYWALNGGRSELVSVFTYFCHIGYLSENGGILRATNGNNSYGTYGSVAEGYNENETPITGKIDNRTLEAQVEVVHTNGNELVAVGYSHAGQSYTSATGVVSGSGINATVAYDELRNNAISQIRLIDPSDSSTPGGLNYQYLLNNSQGGTTTSITLAASDDTGTPEKYIGMRIVIVSGKGVGQYGYISGYDALTKIAIISKEYNDTSGWENLYPGRPIETTLDGTTRYSLEPRVIIDDPGVTITNDTSKTFPTDFLTAGSGGKWASAIQYSNGTYVVINRLGETAISTDGTTFTAGQDLGVAWGFGPSGASGTNMFFQNGAVVYNYDTSTSTWTNFAIQNFAYTGLATNQSTGLSMLSSTGGVTRFTPDGVTNQAIGGISSGGSIIGVAYGNGIWVLLQTNGTALTSVNEGVNWTLQTGVLDTAVTWTDIAYGNGRFVAVGKEADAAKAAYSFDGVTWYYPDESLDLLPGTGLENIIYTAGQFIATTTENPSFTNYMARSKDGFAWQWFAQDSTVYTLNDAGHSLAGSTSTPEGEWFIRGDGGTGSAGNSIITVQTGAGAVARVNVSSSRLQSFTMYDPGANYLSVPGVLVVDPEKTIDGLDQPRIASGVLAQPIFTNRGAGYVTATMTVAGDGFADIFQTGKTINLKNVSLVPGPGANVVINGIDDVTYRLTKIVSQSGSAPNLNITVNISPTITNQNSPNHEETLILREQYSQVRLTGHDFLDVGVGNVNSTRYPQLYLEGEDPETPRQPFNETVDNGGGRVFYTSTDQDGNFRVGELFAVEQASGTVTVNADLFELDGLTELSLGGIQVGGSAVVIKEFSKDGTFVANSNNIVPTQAAIITYLKSRISSGGADALTNTLIAGQVKVSSTNFTTTSGLQINIPVSVHQTGGIDGDMLAHQLFGI
jgi:hypothetical protein